MSLGVRRYSEAAVFFAQEKDDLQIKLITLCVLTTTLVSPACQHFPQHLCIKALTLAKHLRLS
jgi:hypothetical protein